MANKLKIELQIDNEAMSYPGEKERVLKEGLERLGDKEEVKLLDLNGNTVGYIRREGNAS